MSADVGARVLELAADAGVAMAQTLPQAMKQGDVSETSSGSIQIEEIDQDCVVDPDIRYGDQIGFFVCNRSRFARFWPGRRIWMRSADLSVTSEDVMASYNSAR